jgi:hypothetical protein
MERNELKKACISILTRQWFGGFDAIVEGEGIPGHPRVDVDEAANEGPYIRFFEQAFEWHNIAYVLYPYFWGRMAEWLNRINYKDDNDPLFESFLKAGTARVVVPVRPGFTEAIDHFMSVGELWNGGEAAGIGSETYVPIIVEQREHLGAPGDEVAQGEPWEVTLPTSLVILRADGSLPRWRKNERGAWVPDE